MIMGMMDELAPGLLAGKSSVVELAFVVFVGSGVTFEVLVTEGGRVVGTVT